MIRLLAAMALASAATATAAAPAETDKLVSTASWWEKVTVSISGDGEAQSCQFVSSLNRDAAQQCSVSGSQAALVQTSGSKEQVTRITFERRFTPDSRPESVDIKPGDTFLGGQVMALAIDGAGAVKGCRVVATSGEMKPDYGCDEASAEKFEASASTTQEPARVAYMTILVYGHAENLS